MTQLRDTLFRIKVGKDGKERGKLRPEFAASTLTYEEWLPLHKSLFHRPAPAVHDDWAERRTICCGRTLVVTLSARPDARNPADSWDAEQFEAVRDAIRVVCQRNQYQQVLALARTAVEARKLDQVGGGDDDEYDEHEAADDGGGVDRGVMQHHAKMMHGWMVAWRTTRHEC
jgi:hypothetical protein